MKRARAQAGVCDDVADTDGDHDMGRLAFRLVVLWSGEENVEGERAILSDYSKEASAVYGGLIRPYVTRMFTARGLDLSRTVHSKDVDTVRRVLNRVVGAQFTHPTSYAATAKRRGPYRCSVCKAFKKGGCLCAPALGKEVIDDGLLGLDLI